MNSYKTSMYNIVEKMDDERYLIYNTLSSCVALLNEEEVEQLNSSSICDEEMIIDCKKMGFIVDFEEDELEKVCALRNMNNFNMNHAGFQILPTTGCNARCFYCYEQGYKSETMTEDTIEATILFIKSYASTVKQLSIAWFGGEPLLRFDVIERISQELMPFCDSIGVIYTANIITNATLLDDEKIEKFKKYKIESVQITVDGYDKVHDLRKNYQDGKSDYHLIISNIKKLVDSEIKVLVRFNIDKNNFESCLKAIDDLKEICGNGEYIWPYLAPLYSDVDASKCFSSEEIGEVFAKGYKKLIDCGYIQTINGLPMNFENASCCATMINNFVISPSGKIYKCEHLLGDESDQVGDVFDGIVFNKAMCSWVDPKLPEECCICSYLPLCQAGCRAAVTRGFGYGRCSYIKFTGRATAEAARYLLELNDKE